jgi:hypothetical protein
MWLFDRECHQPKQSNSPRALAPVINQQRGQQKGPALRTGHANYTTVEEIPTGEQVLAGMFFLNEHPIIVSFGSGASHDFISSTCAKKAVLSMVATKAPYVISTPGGRVDVDRIVRKAPLKRAERVFSTDPIILKGQGLDVILGMSWMKLLSHPVFMLKPCIHRMYAQDQLFHTYGQKVLTNNQMS